MLRHNDFLSFNCNYDDSRAKSLVTASSYGSLSSRTGWHKLPVVIEINEEEEGR